MVFSTSWKFFFSRNLKKSELLKVFLREYEKRNDRICSRFLFLLKGERQQSNLGNLILQSSLNSKHINFENLTKTFLEKYEKFRLQKFHKKLQLKQSKRKELLFFQKKTQECLKRKIC